ncbi:urease accessory protein UreE [Derxia lacustris]|uniref:hypothetical protein n=1 Tax=Derxia lacustris TaxID=764842 RepID=UPI000A16DD45|nr:hypothetical protein [Derxia lacustris]
MSDTISIKKILGGNARPAGILLKRALPIDLTSAQRATPQLIVETTAGTVELALEAPVAVGDVLLDSRGAFWLVGAAEEDVIAIAGPAPALARLAAALGGEHVPLAVTDDGLLILPGVAPEAWLAGFGVTASAARAAFRPEAPAPMNPVHVHDEHCGCGHDHGHDHAGHDHGHAHAHADHGHHDHGHEHHDHGHKHHDHGHKHG